MNDDTNDIEARLRQALTARADAVEPGAGTEAAVVARMAVARRTAARRRTLLAAAAVVAVVAAVAAAVVLTGDDDTTDVATGGPTTTTTAIEPPPTSTEPVIWPLPTMSVQYDDPAEAAETFMTAYAGLAAPDCSLPDEGSSDAQIESRRGALDVTCVVRCPESASCVAGVGTATTTVHTGGDGTSWRIVGADADRFDIITPQSGAVVGADIEVRAEHIPPGATLTAKVPPLGADPAGSPSAQSSLAPDCLPPMPTGEEITDWCGATWTQILGAADGPTVLVVSDGSSVTARVFTVDSAAVPPETTTTTTGPTDDGVQGWPGPTSRQFDTAESAAQAFVTDVLGFADPALADLTEEGSEAQAVYHPRPTASITTTISLHHTGTARGWVVTGTTSDQGTIDEATLESDNLVVRGVSTAFEAQIQVVVLYLDGTVVTETYAMGGANGALGPFEAQLELFHWAAETPALILIGEIDNVGDDGRYAWATITRLDELLAAG